MASYFTSRSGSIAGNDLHIHPGIETRPYGIGNIFAHRIGYGDNTDKCQIDIAQTPLGKTRLVVIENLVSKTQCTHRLRLIGKQLLVHSRFILRCRKNPLFGKNPVALTQNDLRSALYIKDLFPYQRRIDNSCHIFTLGRESELVDDRGRFPQFEIILALRFQPQKQCSLGRITDDLRLLPVGHIEKSRRIDGNTFPYQIAQLTTGKRLIF